jgi:hypothetical protein
LENAIVSWEESAKKTSSPVDDIIVSFLKTLLGL